MSTIYTEKFEFKSAVPFIFSYYTYDVSVQYNCDKFETKLPREGVFNKIILLIKEINQFSHFLSVIALTPPDCWTTLIAINLGAKKAPPPAAPVAVSVEPEVKVTTPVPQPKDEEDAPTAGSAEEEGAALMVERLSLYSEDLESVEQPKSLRPCEFVPPPPPSEPPPEDSSEDGSPREKVDKETVVNEDNTSLAPASLKNSPVSGKCLRCRLWVFLHFSCAVLYPWQW